MAEISRNETVRMLDAVPLFTGLTKRQLTAVAKLVDHVSFGTGSVLVKEMDVGRRLIIISEGTAAVMLGGAVARDEQDTGSEKVVARRIATVGPGDVVGELSILDGSPTSASVVAETPVEALVLYRTRFNHLLNSMPQLYPRLIVGLVGRIRDIDRRAAVVG